MILDFEDVMRDLAGTLMRRESPPKARSLHSLSPECIVELHKCHPHEHDASSEHTPYGDNELQSAVSDGG